MFKPETEDMLPRMAPKPTAPALSINEALAKPTVPEVSILFGPQQQAGSSSSVGGGGAPQSYAAWKKQMLPKVTFPPNADAEQTTQRSTLYPLRSVAIQPQTITGQGTLMCAPPPVSSPSASSSNEFRRNLEPTTTAAPSLNSLGMSANVRANLLQQQQRRSLDAIILPSSSSLSSSPRLSTQEVLTICAGTQTELSGEFGQQHGLSPLTLQNLATKEDLQQFCALLEAMKDEQKRLREMCEALLMQPPSIGNQQEKILMRDAETQCNDMTNPVSRRTVPTPTPTPPQSQPPPPLMQQFIAEEDALEEEKEVDAATIKRVHQMYLQQTPRTVLPAAQSTGYRPSTPQQQQQQPTMGKNIVAVLPKPATEKSMVMTELALKYLPNDKLNELMQELEVSPVTRKPSSPATVDNKNLPLRGIENFGKASTELSNASYKYLKKYRLLPEENCQNSDAQPAQIKSPIAASTAAQPKIQSPLVLEPAANGDNDYGAARLEQFLDFERIRKQPKFL